MARARNALERQEVRCYDHDAPTRKVTTLRESDPSPDDDPADLPLWDEVSAEHPPLTLDPRPIPPAQRPMFGATAPGESESVLSPADAGDDDRTARGISMWVVAAASLVIGILIGFASGYTAARPDEPAAAIALPEAEPEGTRDPASAGSTQTFTEDKVDRVDPVPIVPSAEPDPAAAPRAAAPVAPPPSGTAREASRPTAPAAGRAPTAAPAARGQAPGAEPRAPADAPRTPGPSTTADAPARGSMEVVSRPAGAQVVLDGLVIGKTPMVLAEVPSGTHSVRLELPGFQQWATSVDVNPGQRTRVAASLEQ
jgi:hypothetical protein